MVAGIFISFDFTINKMIFTEARSYNELLPSLGFDEIHVFDFDEKASNIIEEFTFKFTYHKITSYEDFHLFTKADVLFTWQWHQEFRKMKIVKKQVDVYKILSDYTNVLKRKIYFRICDTRHFMRDYKYMIEQFTVSKLFQEVNGSKLFSLTNTDIMNYDLCYYICNGSRTICDWSWKTLRHAMPFLEVEQIQEHTTYISDDILFRYTELYEKMSHLEKTEKIPALYNVGNLNDQKVLRFKEILTKKTTNKVKSVLRSSMKTVFIDQLKDYNVEILTPSLNGEIIFEEISKYTAYVFIGNGDADLSYHNKTLYDASIARTVFLIYQKTDCYGTLKELSDYYFNDEKELIKKFKWISQNYKSHLKIQRDFLLKHLSTETITL